LIKRVNRKSRVLPNVSHFRGNVLGKALKHCLFDTIRLVLSAAALCHNRAGHTQPSVQ
jgi:hypothetical protein